MKACHLVVAVLVCIGFKLNADDQLSDETREFMLLNHDGRVQEASSITSEAKLRRVQELKEAAIRNRAGKASYMNARAFLGDEEAIQQLVAEFIENDGASPGVLGDTRNPRIIEMVAPEFFRNEPMRLYGGDVVLMPRSFRAAELAVEILGNSPAFNAEVINWARRVGRLKWSDQRELVRPWWKANEQFFREKNYQAVQPGPEPPERPAAPPEAPVAAPSVAPATPPTPITAAAETPAVPAERQSPVWPWLVGIAALVVIVAVALKRRA